MMIRRKEILGPYINGAIYINDNSNCETIGMDIENGYLEYPLWNMLVDLEHPKRNLTHINVSNESKLLFGYDNSICSIIAINQLEKKQVITYQNFEYTLSFFEQPVAVYIKKY